MKQVYAYMNHGRWLARCPIHDFGNKLEVKKGEGFVPPCCYPKIIAVIRTPNGGFIPDRSARETARKLAEQNGDVYQVVFPDEYESINAEVKHRKEHNRNWLPGETIAWMQADEARAKLEEGNAPLALRVIRGEQEAVAELDKLLQDRKKGGE